ncbi:E3 ubiquitin-protein ligase RGLG4-like isoform X2 [Arachis stenosperma]|uniref:E3 ubiquitin-protein ligase RGLG4-like isoform X2 n=1 Tax=Arachis stenosperma TaxID=217475 RepID=UPI0025ACB145|nr:E3 ubiquitin-protein ligase RGLG4-like isoform X2 [Arachis stenosperma]
MGNLIARKRNSGTRISRNNTKESGGRNNSNYNSSAIDNRPLSLSQLRPPRHLVPPQYPSLQLPPLRPQRAPSMSRAQNKSGQEGLAAMGKKDAAKKYTLIKDNFTSLEQVTTALRKEGLESSNLILGIDFTKSNEWTATTHDQEVFSFHSDHTPCHGFEEVLACYQKIVPNLKLSGPTSYAPVIEAAIDIVEKNHGQFHVLVIIADGQVTRSVNTEDGELSPQEQKTIKAIVDASEYPLAIILVGVGDGPWEDMQKFDDKIPARGFDNFQFVNFTAIMSKNIGPSEKEAAFALAALMEIPFQYKATLEFGILGRVTGRAKKIVAKPPPVPYSRHVMSNAQASPADDRNQTACPVCLTNAKELAFGCGHMTCRDCASRLSNCPICRERITSRLRVFTG